MAELDDLVAREATLAHRLQRLLAAEKASHAELTEVDDAIAEYAFTLSQCADADDSQALQVKQFERQVRRLRHGLDGSSSPGAGGPAGPAARRRAPAPAAGTAASASLAFTRATAAPTRGASLRATRDLLELEVHRMSAAGEMLARDAAAMAGTLAEHGAYGADVAVAGAAVSTYASREARDRLHMRLAFVLFTLIAAYVVGRRAAWTLAGVALPGL
jgi:hypothetical protein